MDRYRRDLNRRSTEPARSPSGSSDRFILSSNAHKLSAQAREIQDAFPPPVYAEPVAREEELAGPVDIEDESGRAGVNNQPLVEEFKRLKLLYSQVVMKNRFLEEENKLLHLLEEKLNKKEKEIRQLHKSIDQLKKEVDSGRNKIEELNKMVIEKEQDAEAYKNLIEEKQRPRWRRLLGGR